MKIADLFVKLGLKDRDFKRGIDGAEKRTNKFSSAMQKVGGMIAGVFAVGQIARFTAELVKLGGTAEGVRAAFNRIADDRVLRDLQKATAGTVGELELMQRTVMASNFDIPVEQLASLFKFATKRAQETGESVDYLVNSIVVGIGRKSPLILDNLGISAIQLRQKLDNVGHSGATVGQVAAAVGEIAEEAMKESGEIIDTNAIKVQNLAAMWQDTKLAIAENKAVIESVGDSLSKLQKMLFVWGAETATGWEKAAISVELFDKRAERIYEQVFKREQERQKIADAGADMAASNAAAMELSRKKEEKQIVTVIDRIRELERQLSESRKLLKPTTEITIFEQAIDDVKELESELEKLKNALPRAGIVIPTAMTGQSGTPQVGQTMAPVPEGLANMSFFLEQNAERTRQYMDDMNSEWEMFGNRLSETIQSGAVDAISEFATLIGELFSGSINGESFFNRILGQLGRFLATLGKMIIAYGVAMEAFQLSLQNIFSGVGALGVIAAGAALVAIGGGIASYASGAASGGSPSGGGASVNFGIFSNRNGMEYQQGTQSQTFLKGTDIHINQSRVDTQQSLIG